MREIKFRAWHSYKSKPKGMIYLEPTKQTFHSRDLVENKDWAVMQYTGLKDKYGKEIYEGDIVSAIVFGEGSIHKIEYGDADDYPAFELSPDLDCDCNSIQYCLADANNTLEVIGNIYENKELLK